MPMVLVAGAQDPFADRLAGMLDLQDGYRGPGEGLRGYLEKNRSEILVYCAGSRGSQGLPDLQDAEKVFTACAEAEVTRVIVVSSSAANEPSSHNLCMLSEDRPAARRTSNPLPDLWLNLEAIAHQVLGDTATGCVILRPAATPVAGGQDFFSRLLGRRWAVTPMGYDPTIQVLALEDLAAALRLLASHSEISRGAIFHLAPRAGIPLNKALRLAGTWRLPLPIWLQALGRKVLAPMGLAAPVEHLDYLRYPWTVSDAKIRRELEHQPAFSSYRAVEKVVKKTPSVEEPEFDPWGLDKVYIERMGRTLFRFLHNAYWRIEYRGLENLPRQGGAVLTGVHRGFQPWDGVMAMHLISRELGRYVRFLIHPTLVKFPFLAPYMTKCGGILACQENAAWVLERGKIAAVFPEGIRGAFRLYKDVYKLGKFGRDEYVRMALKYQVPIVPFVTVGSAEIYPIYGKIRWRWLKRYTEWPFLPVTPTMGTVPLPSKWHTDFLEPIPMAGYYPPEAADDLETVRAISLEVRRRLEEAIAQMLQRRKSIFYGSVFEAPTRVESKAS